MYFNRNPWTPFTPDFKEPLRSSLPQQTLKASHPQQPLKSSHPQQPLRRSLPQQTLTGSHPELPTLAALLLWSGLVVSYGFDI